MAEALDRFGGVLLGELGDVRIRLTRLEQNARIPASHHFSHAGEIVLTFHRADAVAPITIFVRQAIAEANH